MGGRDKFRGGQVRGAGGGIKSKGDQAVVRPDRNKACPCGSTKKYKKCHGAPLVADAPPTCSVKLCDEPVAFFISPVVDGGDTRADQYWVSCADHVEGIAGSAAQHGIDVDVAPFDATDHNLEAVPAEEAAE